MQRTITTRYKHQFRTALLQRAHQQQNLQLHHLKQQLEQRSHLFIVGFGTALGAILAMFIAYHLSNIWSGYLIVAVLPLLVAYGLRKVYVHTLSHTIEEDF
ncbi:hypothetical protein [Acinetobacter indicus]|uniref:hypothetical protein n=1 Tax=Acinetobacter indicus TaxID=756892 RepID=UPI000CEB9247|nr:hypothetical protein [Acinetobacter indicus]